MTNSSAKKRTFTPTTEDRRDWLESAQEVLGYCFVHPDYLEEALTHRSFATAPSESNYERLEFLGDALLELVVSERLLRQFPLVSEGDLTRMRALLVSRENLAILARRMGLGQLLRLGNGEEKTGGRRKKALLADVFESVAGAIYLDGGLEPAREFLFRHMIADFEQLEAGDIEWRDHKSRLQETLHSQGKSAPAYRVVEETGPPHERNFRVEVQIEGKTAGTASGSSKKKAEQKAAESALCELDLNSGQQD